MADMEQEHTQPEAPANTQNLVDLGTSLIQREEGRVYVLTIVGQIEGHQLLPSGMKSTKYEHVLPLLAAVEGDPDNHGLLILLNNAGGDVEAGLAIAELIASMSKPTASLVLGGSHSIGVPLAVAAKQSFAVPSAAMTTHPVRTTGTVIAAPQTTRYFQRLQERIVAFVAGHSRIGEGRFEELLLRREDLAADVGSVLYGREAVDVGLIDRLGGLSDALECLYGQIAQRREERA